MSHTQFVFYANTPFVNALKTIHFKSKYERDQFFDTKMNSLEFIKYGDSRFNMVRDRLVVSVNWDHDRGPLTPGSPVVSNPLNKDMIGVNYCYFMDSNINERIYCQVVKTEYINDKVTKFYLSVDILMTYFQGDFTNQIGNVHIKRQHLTQKTYEDNLYILANSDRLITTTPQIIHQKHKPFGSTELVDDDSGDNIGGKKWKTSDRDMYVVFQCSADLSKNFGNIDEPKLSTSGGNKYNKVISPVNLYACSVDDALELFKELSDYPWISQNIKNITLIPIEFIDTQDLKPVTAKSINATRLFTFKHGSVTNIPWEQINSVFYSFDEVDNIISSKLSMANSLAKEKHLYNSGYFKFYITNWSGASLELLPEKLASNNYNLEFRIEGIIGYDNKIAIVPLLYNSNGENLTYGNERIRINVRRGEYLNAALLYNSWDTLPILIDNYKMSLSSTAYSRKLTEDSMLSNQIDNLKSGGSEEMPWWESAMRVGGTLFGGSAQAAAGGFGSGGLIGGAIAGVGNTLFNGFNSAISEKQYYRELQAQRNQLKLNQPTITNQNMGNAYAYKQGVFGLSVKLYSVPIQELKNAIKYHKSVGYQWERFEQPESIMSMSHVNYLEIDGEWYLDNVPTEFMKMAKEMFKQGVSFYHNPEGLLNPFNDDIMKNKRIK